MLIKNKTVIYHNMIPKIFCMITINEEQELEEFAASPFLSKSMDPVGEPVSHQELGKLVCLSGYPIAIYILVSHSVQQRW